MHLQVMKAAVADGKDRAVVIAVCCAAISGLSALAIKHRSAHLQVHHVAVVFLQRPKYHLFIKPAPGYVESAHRADSRAEGQMQQHDQLHPGSLAS